MIEEIFTDLAPLSDKLGVTLTAEGDGIMTGSDALIYRLIFNLTENAVKYNRPGGSVQVSVTQELEKLLLRVSDTGCGIPPERMAHLFDGCFQPGHPTPAPYGLGLGLPLCRAIAEKHGGSITVESAPGKGSRFMVSLPDRQLGSQLSDIPSVYNGGFSRPLLGLADALPSDAFAVRNLE